MRLAEVIADVAAADRDVEITGLTYDNRALEPGDLFFCVRGFTRDGHDFAPDAVARARSRSSSTASSRALIKSHRLWSVTFPPLVAPAMPAFQKIVGWAVPYFGISPR